MLQPPGGDPFGAEPFMPPESNRLSAKGGLFGGKKSPAPALPPKSKKAPPPPRPPAPKKSPQMPSRNASHDPFGESDPFESSDPFGGSSNTNTTAGTGDPFSNFADFSPSKVSISSFGGY